MRKSIRISSVSKGFTLIELLSVIAIIAVLSAILIPSIKGVFSKIRSAKCQNNLRHLYTAAMAYAADNEGYLPVGHGNRIPGCPPGTFEPAILAYSQLSEVYGIGSITRERAIQLAMQRMHRDNSILACPDDPDPTPLYPTNPESEDYNVRSYYGSVDILLSTRDEFLQDQTRVIYKRRIDDPRLMGSMLLYADTGNGSRPARYTNDWAPCRHGGTPSPTNNGKENPGGLTNMVFLDGHVDSLTMDEIPIGSTSEESKRFWAPPHYLDN